MLKRILVLDDNPGVLDVIKEALSYEKFEVLITTDCKNFFNMIETYQPDLIMLDYKLSDANGDDLCRKVKNDQRFHDIPVVICSAYVNKNDFLSCSYDAIIPKPFGLEELIGTISGLVEQGVDE